MGAKKKIVIAAGTGFLGQGIIRNYEDQQTEFVVLTRSHQLVNTHNVRYVYWNAKTATGWEKELEGAEAIINLTGRSINCRHNEQNRRDIIYSRVDSTNAIGIAINRCDVPPKVWINAGSEAFYGNTTDEILTEDSSAGEGFEVEVCQRWEEAFNDLIAPATRKVFLRIGLILGKDGGMLPPFVNLARLGLCGKQGSGKQYFSWLHEKDFTRIIEFAINKEGFEGTINCSAPNPVTNQEFVQTLRKVMRIPFGIPAPAIFVKMGALLLQTESSLLLKGRRVMPAHLQQSGFQFSYPTLVLALNQILT